jgi:hypothetical protein
MYNFLTGREALPHGRTPPFGRKASILEILQVFLWLKYSPSQALNKIEHF